jgi:hypothetical protein
LSHFFRLQLHKKLSKIVLRTLGINILRDHYYFKGKKTMRLYVGRSTWIFVVLLPVILTETNLVYAINDTKISHAYCCNLEDCYLVTMSRLDIPLINDFLLNGNNDAKSNDHLRGSRYLADAGRLFPHEHDVSFVAYENGVVYDKNTELEWIAGPDKDTTWNEAKNWVNNLRVAGGKWRMPTRDELKTLFIKEMGSRNMTQFLATTGWYVWSVDTKGWSSAWGLTFRYGFEFWSPCNFSRNKRGFAVRYRK